MILFPAIDLRGGCVVRLRQGRSSEQTIYSSDPLAVALRWQAEGAQWLHIVDLDAALGDEKTNNAAALRQIRDAIKIRIQFGGGLRDLSAVQCAFDNGADRVVIGTLGVEEPDLLAEIVSTYGPDKIAVALDAREGRVATRGWRTISNSNQIEFGTQMREIGIRLAIVTDISRDGMLTGIDAGKLAAVARETGLREVASGGIASLDDLESLMQFESEGIEGAILGQSLYTGTIGLAQALQVTSRPNSSC